MSDQQTVREALKVSETFRGEDGYLGVRIKGDQELIDALGIDPDMTVETLKQRLLIAERVLRVAESERTWIDPYSEDESNVIWDWIDRLTGEEVSP